MALPAVLVAQAYADESLGIIKKQKEMIERMQGDNSVRSLPWNMGYG